jgi:hypothetical protein
MAQYYTDFEEYTAGETPSDWTPKLDATANWLIYEDATFGKCLRNTSTASGRKLITWDAVPDTADVEVYFEFFAPVGSLVVSTFGAARVDPSKNAAAASAHFYRFGFDEETIDAGDALFDKGLDGTFTSVTSAEKDLGFAGATVFACRASFVGTAVKVRCWDTASAEPSTWDIETTDSSISAAGAVGLFRFSTFNPGNYRYNAFGVGTGGDPAPTSASATTPVSFSGTVPTQNLTQDSAMSALDLSTYFSGTETPFTYAVQTGTLPAGLSLNSSTGVISGTPTATGTSSIVVRATDDATDTADTNSFDIVVAAASVPTVTVTDVLKNNTGTVRASETGIVASVLNATTLASVHEATGLTTDASGNLDAIADNAITTGNSYYVAIKTSTGGIGIAGPYTAT